MNPDEFVVKLYACTDTDQPEEVRSDLVMQMFYFARSQMKGLALVVENTELGDPIHKLAQDQLDTLLGFLTEKQGEA